MRPSLPDRGYERFRVVDRQHGFSSGCRRELILDSGPDGDSLPFNADLRRLTQLTRLELAGNFDDHLLHYFEVYEEGMARTVTVAPHPVQQLDSNLSAMWPFAGAASGNNADRSG